MLTGKRASSPGARGIGAGIVRALAAQGARVAVLDLDLAEAEKTAAALPVPGLALACDVADEADVRPRRWRRWSSASAGSTSS